MREILRATAIAAVTLLGYVLLKLSGALLSFETDNALSLKGMLIVAVLGIAGYIIYAFGVKHWEE